MPAGIYPSSGVLPSEKEMLLKSWKIVDGNDLEAALLNFKQIGRERRWQNDNVRTFVHNYIINQALGLGLIDDLPEAWRPIDISWMNKEMWKLGRRLSDTKSLVWD